MIERVFDPALQAAPLAVRTDPGKITIGPANFIEPNEISGFELSPIQAALLVLALTKAIEAELVYSLEIEASCRGRRGSHGFGFEGFEE